MLAQRRMIPLELLWFAFLVASITSFIGVVRFKYDPPLKWLFHSFLFSGLMHIYYYSLVLSNGIECDGGTILIRWAVLCTAISIIAATIVIVNRGGAG